MSEVPPLTDALRNEIDRLARDIEAALKYRPRRSLAAFEPRRRALLERHLGRRPPRDPEVVYCLGDSHTMFFAGTERLGFIHYRRTGWWSPNWINRGLDLLPLFRTFHVGAATAWRAPDHGSSTRAREKIELLIRRGDVPRGAKLLLSFGEIDCRVHLPRAIQGGKPMDDAVRATAEQFLRLPDWLRAQGFDVLIWAPPHVLPKDEDLDAAFPFVGTWEFRRDITLAYLDALHDRCRAENFPVASLYGHYHPADRKIPEGFCHDGIHLSQRLMPLALKKIAATGFIPESHAPD